MQDKTKSRVLTAVSMVALAVVVVSPAAASWHGLVGTGHAIFGLRGGWEYLVPLTLDGAALYSGTLAIRAILSGDSAFGARLLTALYALAAAGFNGYHAAHVPTGNAISAVFFAGASLSAVVLWDVTLRALRRDQLREAGLVEAPLPRWRMLRWLVAPIETARAWRLAVVEGITDPAEALHITRAARTTPLRHVLAERIADVPTLPASATNDQGGTTDGRQDDTSDRTEGFRTGDVAVAADHRGCGDVRGADTGRGSHSGEDGRELVHDRGGSADGIPAPDLRGLNSKKAALRAAFDTLGSKDVPAALELLHEQGVTVDRSYAYTVSWTPPPPPLHAVGGER